MKRFLIFGVSALFLLFGVVAFTGELSITRGQAQSTEPAQVKIPEIIILGKDSKLGQVTFNHVSHNGGKYSIDGTGPIACIECHHLPPAANWQNIRL